MNLPLAITLGDPAGIGPEIIAKAFLQAPDDMTGCFVAGDVALLRRACHVVAPDVALPVVAIDTPDEALAAPPRCVPVLQVLEGAEPVLFGQVSALAGRLAGESVVWAARAALRGEVAGMVTAPLHKEALSAAGAPFNALLAARVEEKLTGELPQQADASVLAAIGPALAGELSKILYLASRALPLLILFLVPGLNILVSIGWVLFGFWFLTIEYADYPMGNHGIAPRDQRKHLRSRRWKSLLFGAGVTTLMLIPVLQFAAMPAAVAGATRLWVDDLQPD